MFSEQRRREEQALLAHDYALECAEAKGIERGLERGRAEGIEQGLERGRAEGIEQGLERGRAEGIEQGLERGKVEGSFTMLANLVRQGILTSEVASQQLGMTVEEFEELLEDHHQ